MDTPISGSQSGRLAYKWIVVLVVIFGSFMSILDQTVVNNALPHLQSAFGIDFNSLQWVISAYTLTQGVVTPTTAFFANRLGAKRFYVISLIFFTLGSALCGLAWNFSALIVFRVIQAIGGATLFPLAISFLFFEFPREQRGLATGILGISSLMAPAIGPTLGGYLVTYASWPLIFYINVPVGIVAVTLAIVLLRERPADAPLNFDLPGFLLISSGLVAVLYGLSNASTSGWESPTVLITLVSGLILLAVFALIELGRSRRQRQVLVDLSLFTHRPFLVSNIANALISFAFFGSMILFPVYMQEVRGLSAFVAALYTLPLAFSAVLAALVGGRLVDRFGPRVVLFPGLILMTGAAWLLTGLRTDTPYGLILLINAINGLGLGCVLQPLTVASLSSVQPRQYTQASSLNTVMRFTFTSLGIAVLATYVQSRASTHMGELAHQLRPSSQAALLLLRQQGLSQAVDDAFWISLIALILAFITVLFLRVARATPQEKELAPELIIVE